MTIKYVISLFLLTSCFIKNKKMNEMGILICGYLLFRWLTDYRKCTVSYIECKIRGVPKEEGYIYNILESLFDINKDKNRIMIYVICLLVLAANIYNKHY